MHLNSELMSKFIELAEEKNLDAKNATNILIIMFETGKCPFEIFSNYHPS